MVSVIRDAFRKARVEFCSKIICYWACLTNKFCSSQSEVELYNHLYTDPANDSILEKAAAILKSCYSKKMSIRVIQPRKGTDDCGALAIGMAYNMCRHLDPFQHAYDQSKLRLDIEQVFICRSFHGINFSEP